MFKDCLESDVHHMTAQILSILIDFIQDRAFFVPFFRSFFKSLRAIFCKSHPTCDSRVFRISSYFNQLKIEVILEHGRNFGFIKHFVEFLGGSRDNSNFSRTAISVPKLYFESHLSLLELLFRVQVTST